MTRSGKPSSRTAQKFLIWFTIIPLAAFALFFVAALTGDILSGNFVTQDDPASGKTTLGVLIGSGFCAGILPAVFVVLLIRKLVKIHRLEKAEHDAWIQDSILELAKKLGGKVTVVETTTELNMSLVNANTALNQFIAMGLARLQVSESGVLVYYFDQIIGQDEKNRAESV
ncbi:hypothetical protein JNM05_01835 [bacterium]|nr:hypothetical protein [bacterium]